MKNQEIAQFEARVKAILSWSALDAGTRDILTRLMAEVAALADDLTSRK